MISKPRCSVLWGTAFLCLTRGILDLPSRTQVIAVCGPLMADDVRLLHLQTPRSNRLRWTSMFAGNISRVAGARLKSMP